MKYEPETVGDRVLIHVKRVYVTQTNAAKAWGISLCYLNQVVHGKRPPPQVVLDALGLEWRLVPKEAA
jgi:hypothetical protein